MANESRVGGSADNGSLNAVESIPDVYRRYEDIQARVADCIYKHGVGNTAILDKWFRGVRWDVRLLYEKHGFGEKKVLDIGCSYGSSLFLWGAASEGVEVNENCVALLEAMGKKVYACNVEHGIWEEVPDGSFEAVFSSNLVEHLVAPHLFFANMYRVLQDDGLLALQHPVVVPVFVSKLARMLPPVRRLIGQEGWHAGEHINFFTPRTIRLSLERAGFSVLEQHGGYFRTLPSLGRRLVPYSAKCLTICKKHVVYRYSKKRVETFDPDWARQLLRQYR